MNHHKGFTITTVLLVVLGIIIMGGVGYVVMNQQAPVEKEDATTELSITWNFTDAGETEGVPHTKVSVAIDGTTYEAGTFTGSCSEIGSNGGVKGNGLLPGELSAAQCWFAGGGNEIGVFAHEDGGYAIMVGDLGEEEEGAGVFRGNFSIKHSISL